MPVEGTGQRRSSEGKGPEQTSAFLTREATRVKDDEIVRVQRYDDITVGNRMADRRVGIGGIAAGCVRPASNHHPPHRAYERGGARGGAPSLLPTPYDSFSPVLMR
jgi:hypothetical protein